MPRYMVAGRDERLELQRLATGGGVCCRKCGDVQEISPSNADYRDRRDSAA